MRCSRAVSLSPGIGIGIAIGLAWFGTASAQIIETVAGGGPNDVPALAANLNLPSGVAVDSAGNLFIALTDDDRVFKIDGSGQLTRIAGSETSVFSGDGGPAARIITPRGIALDSAGNLFISDWHHSRINRLDAATGVVSVVAGNGTSGFGGDGGPALEASLSAPCGIALDAAGNLFIADFVDERVRRVDAATGIIATVAGNGSDGFSGDGGPATAASLAGATGIALDAAGNLFIADRWNNRIRRVDAATGIITTVAGNGSDDLSGDGGPATAAGLDWPVGVALDAAGNLFIAEQGNYRIRRVDAATGIIATVAGNGSDGFSGDGYRATFARLADPSGVALDAAGNLFIADTSNERIRRVDAATEVITSVAGNGTTGFGGDGSPAPNASLSIPAGVGLDASDNLFIADTANFRIRRLDAATGIITSVAGNGVFGFGGDGVPATSARLKSPSGVALDVDGNLFIADFDRIRRVDAATQIISTVAGNRSVGFSGDDGPATAASLNGAQDVARDGVGNLFIADRWNNRIRRVDAASGIITTVAGNGAAAFSGDGGTATSASLTFPTGVALDADGNLFIADLGNGRVRRVDAATGIIATVAGNGNAGFSGDCGPATSASLFAPSGIALDAVGNLFIADSSNDRIRRVDAATGIITTFAGNGVFGFGGDGGSATSASFRDPAGVAVDAAGRLFIADSLNDRIRLVAGPLIKIAIDIKPGSTQNAIHLASRGVIPVAILGSEDFDVSAVDGMTLVFANATPAHDLGDSEIFADHLEDVDGDGFTDFLSHFRTQETGIAAGDVGACLSGSTLDGVPFQGNDMLRTVPRHGAVLP